MLTYEEALETLLAAAQTVSRTEIIDSHLALGRVLAEAVCSTINVPPTDNSAMDGYALRVADVGNLPTRLPVSLRVPAGAAPGVLPEGTAARIFTGAPIPSGADVVVPQEKCKAEEAGVIFEQALRAGDNIRRAGEDIRIGAEVLPVGTLLGPAHMGLLASIGVAQVRVYDRLRVAAFFTGDELVMPGEALGPGKIYNSNRHVLHGLLGALGCVVTDLGIIPDNLDATRAALREAAKGHDLIMTSGGVSVGEEDHVKNALQAEGELQTWKIAIKPGKPLAFGNVAGTPFIGLPGNPVSGFVTFRILAQPYIRKYQGASVVRPRAVTLRADFSWTKKIQMREFLRVRRNEQGGLDLFPRQGSGVLSSCVWADGMVENPPETVIQPGDMVRYIPFGELLWA
jgi:molybdopterin molybdotransferase